MFLQQVEEKHKSGELPEDAYKTLKQFYHSYETAMGGIPEDIESLFDYFLDAVLDEVLSPTVFEPYHQAERAPMDYYQMGIDLFRPLVIFEESKVLGHKHFKKSEEQINRGENVIFFANHQAELDPQVISLLLEEEHHQLAEEMIFVAGDRVITDPLAAPFSRGRNLLCIYSKRHIDHPPELKEKKQQHNHLTMKKMGELLAEGGHCIYVAPSGGRDRPDAEGKITPAPFTAQSIELFRLIASQSKNPTHFYPLSLVSHFLLPPPNNVELKLGESRETARTPIHIAAGEEIDMINFPGSDIPNKHERRQSRADYIWSLVNDGYQKLTQD